MEFLKVLSFFLILLFIIFILIRKQNEISEHNKNISLKSTSYCNKPPELVIPSYKPPSGIQVKESGNYSFIPVDNVSSKRIQFEEQMRKASYSPPFKNSQKWSLELLQKLEWRRFESVVAAYFRAMGYQTKSCDLGADGGIDIYLYKNNELQALVQCKAWSKTLVGVREAREFFGVLTLHRVKLGFLITSGRFSYDAIQLSRQIRNQGKCRVDLVTGESFLKFISNLSANQQNKLLEFATDGDYSTPTCPHCGIKMVRRVSRSNGSEFWGCRNYPRCHQILH
jgi:HJR/Mrr/RecB family endonuclease